MSTPSRPGAAHGERIAQRFFGGAWLLACLLLAGIAWRYHAAFSYEPVGPRAYPLLCLALMAAGLAWLIARPPPLHEEPDQPPPSLALLRKVGLCIVLLLGHAALFEHLGFVVSSALAGSALAWLAGGRPLPSLLAGTLLSVGLYLLFDRVLEVPLPAGVLAPLFSRGTAWAP